MQQIINPHWVFSPISVSRVRLYQRAGNLTKWHILFRKAWVSKHISKRSKAHSQWFGPLVLQVAVNMLMT